MIKMKFKLTMLWAIFAINAFMIAASTQPSLPTLVYGKVIDANENPVAGIEVIAIWIDSDDLERTTTTRTLSAEEAEALGDKNLAGNYLFNTGYIKAIPHSEIKLVINGFAFEKISSNPGGTVQVKDSILVSKDAEISSSGYGSASGQGTSGTGSGTGNSGSGTDPDPSTSSDDGKQGGAGTEGSPTPNNPNFANSAPMPYPGSSNSYSGVTESPSLPTNMIGQVIDSDGNPVGGETITAEWTDEFGINHTTTVETLTKSEAKALGDKKYEGFYFFNEGDIKAKPNTTVKIMSQARYYSKEIKAEPGETQRVETFTLYGVGDEKDTLVRKIVNRILNSSQKTSVEDVITKDEKPRNRFIWLLFILIALVLTALFYLKKKKKGIRFDFPFMSRLHKGISSLGNTKIKDFMVKEVITTTENETAHEALDSIISRGVNSLVVVRNGIPVGIITEKDFLVRRYAGEGNFENLKVKDMMTSHIITANINSDLYSCIELMLNSNIRKLPIVKNGKLAGIITITDILKVFDGFFSKSIIESANLPIVKSIYTKRVARTAKNVKLSSLYKYMVDNKVDFCIVYESASDPNLNKERAVGILTTKDLLDEIHQSPDSLETLRAENIMKSPIFYVTPGIDILAANKLMLEKGFRRLLVTTKDQIVGVLTQKSLLRSVYYFVKDTTEAVQKSAANKKSGKEDNIITK
jgi:CBS domain-containing protein